jgi:hypothetical protein
MNPISQEINPIPENKSENKIIEAAPSLPAPENEATRESLNEEINDLKNIESVEDAAEDSSISSENVSNFERISRPGVKNKNINPDSGLADKYLKQISK